MKTPLGTAVRKDQGGGQRRAMEKTQPRCTSAGNRQRRRQGGYSPAMPYVTQTSSRYTQKKIDNDSSEKLSDEWNNCRIASCMSNGRIVVE